MADGELAAPMGEADDSGHFGFQVVRGREGVEVFLAPLIELWPR